MYDPENSRHRPVEHLPLSGAQKWCMDELTRIQRPGWCTVEFLVKTKLPVNEPAMQESVRFVVDKYETLRVKIISKSGQWIQEVYPPAEASPYAFYDLSGKDDPDRAEEIKKVCIKERDWLLPERGNMVKIIFFKFSADEGRLWFCMHHAISDFMSAIILASDFMTAYNSIVQDRILKTQPSKEYRKWFYLVEGYCRDVLLPSEQEYWISFPWNNAQQLPSDYPQKFGREEIILDAIRNKTIIGSYRTQLRSIDQEATMQLFGKVSSEMENVLIAIFFLAVANNRKMDCIDMNVCNSGRNILPPDYGINIYKLLGYVAITRVVLLNKPACGDLPSDIRNLMQQIKDIPNGGIGYYLISDYIKNEHQRNSFLGFRKPCFIFFNYLGRLDSNFGNEQFEMVEEDIGLNLYQGEIQNNLLECFIGIKDNQLSVKFTYNEEYLKKETIEEILDDMTAMFKTIGSSHPIQQIEKVAEL